MAEVAAVDVAGCVVKFRDRCRDRARHSCADDERDEFDDGEENSDTEQDVNNTAHEFAERREKVSIEDRRAGRYLQNRAHFGSSSLPVDHRERRTESDLAVETSA